MHVGFGPWGVRKLRSGTVQPTLADSTGCFDRGDTLDNNAARDVTGRHDVPRGHRP